MGSSGRATFVAAFVIVYLTLEIIKFTIVDNNLAQRQQQSMITEVQPERPVPTCPPQTPPPPQIVYVTRYHYSSDEVLSRKENHLTAI